MINEFDVNQLKLMKNRVLNFQEGENNLDTLLSVTKSIEEILNSLKNIDETLKEDLTTEWWELELISSVMMDRKVDNVSAESTEIISLSLENIKNMIDAALDK